MSGVRLAAIWNPATESDPVASRNSPGDFPARSMGVGKTPELLRGITDPDCGNKNVSFLSLRPLFDFLLQQFQLQSFAKFRRKDFLPVGGLRIDSQR